MKRFLLAIGRGITSVESTSTSYAMWLVSFASLIFVRLMIESWLSGFTSHSLQFLFYEFTHTFFFFFLSFLIFWPIVAFFGKASLQSASNVLLFGFLIVLTPPIIDTWIAGGPNFASFYAFDGLAGLWHRYQTLFGDSPYFGVTYGVRIEVVITTILFGLYTYFKTNKPLRAIFASLTTYSILFILGTFPSWLTFIILGFQKSVFAVNNIDIARVFISPITIFNRSDFDFISALNIKMSLIIAPLALTIAMINFRRYFPERLLALIKNARFPQLVYSSGMVCIGIVLGLALTNTAASFGLFELLAILNLCLASNFAWLASVIVNDIFDQKTDTITNAARPLIQKVFSIGEYQSIGITFFFASIIFSAIVSFKAMLFLLVYQAISWMYSAWPLRLKRFPLIATLLAATANFLVLASGFTLISPDETINSLPSSIIIWFMAASIVFISVKDFKDIAGDKADGVYTIPILLGAEKAKLLIGSLIFLLYIISPVILNARILFGPALLCSVFTFWSIQKSVDSETVFFSHRKLPGIVLAIIAAYTGIIAYLLY
jgi:4-hydroxybenzoate polyprenyltransferase